MEKIFPFLWHHGESNEVILEEIERIYECGLRAFCVESRPHPDFCGEGWWKDLGFILKEAQKRGMEVWILDEEHYPSGRCCGKLEKHPELWQKNIIACPVNIVGENKDVKILLPCNGNEEEFVAALAFPIGENGDFIFDGGVDVSDKVYDNVLYWNVPAGAWRVMGLYTTRTLANTMKFVDPFNPKSTKLLIDEIYQPHYEHFKEYFGNTFVGFFADEPRLGNGEQSHGAVIKSNKERTLGVQGMAYNWYEGLIDALKITDKRVIASLWLDMKNDKCTKFRVDYMNHLTEAYAKNYSDLLGNWCRAHGVMFTGHIIEDMGAHCRTMVSCGHYFKSMRGQDIAGIDIINNQVKRNQLNYTGLTHGKPFASDPLFFNFTLAKLAASAARLESVKKGRAFCEIFGAYGWGVSIADMKWMVDFMLVRGINHFVPHAFNPMVEDTDSPPYFYNGGRNPQFSSFVTLMKYLSKMCSHLNDGKAEAKVAVLYHSDAEWSGTEFMPIEEVLQYLTERQIECDIVPDYEINSVDELGVHTTNCNYDLLIIPKREHIDERLKNLLENNKSAWLKINCVSDLEKIEQGKYSTYRLEKFSPFMRVYRYEKLDVVNYFVFNEGITEEKNLLLIKEKGFYQAIDEQNGLSYSGDVAGGLPINLRAGQSILFSITKEELKTKKYVLGDIVEVSPEWKYYVSSYPFTKWELYKTTKENLDIAGYNELPKFAGKIKLLGTFDFEGDKALIDFGSSSLGISVTINGVSLGEKIGAPYIFDAKDSVKNGKNTIEVIMTTTLGLLKRDNATHFVAIEKYGLTQNIKLINYTTE